MNSASTTQDPDTGDRHVIRMIPEIAALPLEWYAKQSTDVVHVRVTAVATQRFPSGLPYTSVRVDVLQSLKGEQASRLELTLAGGQAGAMQVVVDGAPSFSVGDEFVAFVRRYDNGWVCILGLGQGVYPVRNSGERPGVHGLHAQGESVESFFARVASAWIR